MRICQSCGKENYGQAKFCMHCGAPLETETGSVETEALTPEAEVEVEASSKQSKFDVLGAVKNINIGAILENSSKAVSLAMTIVVCYWVYSAFGVVGGIFSSITGFIGDGFQKNSVNITDVILQERTGIQELAVVKNVYNIEKNKTTTQGLLFFDYVTQKFICDFRYEVKYGYDLSSLSKEDIEENKVMKTVKVKLPKGKVISAELINMNIRHNEGIFLDYNKVKAEEIDAIQQEAKREAASRAEGDSSMINMGEAQVKSILERIVHGVAPDYRVVIVRG